MKGMLLHRIANQQQVIAAFSHVDRTVHHNLVSEIARNLIFFSDSLYPPASLDDCLDYLAGHRLGWLYHRAFCERHDDGSTFEFGYRYHPVGQGMFCSGSFSRRGGPPFRWVYDCGTEGGEQNKKAVHVRREIAALAEEQGAMVGRPHLDLVTLSHFDLDHFSGMVDLLTTFSVGIVLLPYLPPWDRLVVALEERADRQSDFLDFLIAPIRFLRNLDGASIERIILVPASGEGPAVEPRLPPDGPMPEGKLDGLIEVPADPAPDEANEAMGQDNGLSSGSVEFLRRGESITVGRAWEFLPYNDASLSGLATDAFKTAARDLSKKLATAMNKEDRKAHLAGLIKLYNKGFSNHPEKKISAKRKNQISLFLYSGPVGNVALGSASEWMFRHRLEPIRQNAACFWPDSDRFGQIYTGDGYLKSPKQWDAFQEFFSPYGRLERGGVFQVMHHGSESNWQPSIAARLRPLASVFCSDPAGRNGHPSEPVLMDFARYGPKQVDAFHGWGVTGRYSML